MNKNYKLILFDLDGTLTDPKTGITKSVQYSLRKFGINEENLDNLEKFIGPPLKNSYMEYYGFTEEEAKLAVDYYREYFAETGIFENKIYIGIEELLKKLKINKIKIALATSKPTVYAEKILKHFNIFQYFDNITGSNLDGTMTDKSEIVKAVLIAFNEIDKSHVVMIGDRKHDIIGAVSNNIDSIGVEYGYGGREELLESRATIIVESVEELEQRILERIMLIKNK